MGSLVYARGSAALSEIFGELRISPALSAPAAQPPDPAFRSHTSQASLSLTQKILLIRVFSLNFLLTKKRAPVLFVSSLFFCC